MSNPLEDLLSFAHRSYVRMEAEQLIQECLVLDDPHPFNQMVEALVFDGASSIYLLREVLEEVQSAKSILNQEGLGVRQDLMEALTTFDVHLPHLLTINTPDDFRQIYVQSIESKTRITAGKLKTEDEELILEIWSEAEERVLEIARRLAFIKHLEATIRDWIGSLAYELMHSSKGTIEYGTKPYLQ